MAARYGNVDVVRYLCSIQANPDLADRVSGSRRPASPHQNQAHASGSYRQKPLLLPLLRFPEQEQETPLHCAAWHGYSAVALALCQAGCNVDAKNREGESPVLTASARGFVDIVQCLVEHGAHLEASDKVRHTHSFYIFIFACVLCVTYTSTYVYVCMYTYIHTYVYRWIEIDG